MDIFTFNIIFYTSYISALVSFFVDCSLYPNNRFNIIIGWTFQILFIFLVHVILSIFLYKKYKKINLHFLSGLIILLFMIFYF